MRRMQMIKSWSLGALVALGTLATVRSACEDIDRYFADVGSVSEIDLGTVFRVDCPANDDGGELEEILIASGTSLTIKSSEPFVRFVNVRFTVEEGATLVFDMPVTRFGPNSGSEEGGSGYMLDNYATVVFMGDFYGGSVKNTRSMFFNSGTMDFKGSAFFYNSGNIFRSNSNGTLKFRGYTVFKNNSYLALNLTGPESYVRFSKNVVFDNNGRGFDGALACAVANRDGTVIFRGDATFKNHRCDEGGAVYNGEIMTFYGKAYFEDNVSYQEDGGGLRSRGTTVFKAAAQFSRNTAEFGGGLYVLGGEVTFNKAVKFDTNGADDNGGAFVVTNDGSLTFKKPETVRYTGNYMIPNEYVDDPIVGCSLGYVTANATLTGFDVDDVCVEQTV